MFLRWLFLFIALANVVILLWYSSFVTEENVPVASQSQKLDSIRLLSEMEPGVLKLKGEQAESKPDECITFSEISQKQVSDWLVSQARAEGLMTESFTESELERFYVIKVDVIDTDESRPALVDYLRESRGLEVGMQDLESGALYVLGRFTERAEAEKELQQVVIAGVPAYLVLEKIEDIEYMVVVYEESGRKLSSEIKELVVERYSDIKITKKVCERVASP